MRRGEIYNGNFSVGPHPAVIITRDTAIPLLTSVVIAMITTNIRGLHTEVPIGVEQGLRRACVINCDNIFTLPKSHLGDYRGQLGPEELWRLDGALKIALGLEY